MARASYTHKIIRDRLSAALCIIFGVYLGYLANRDGVELAPSIFFGILAFVLLAMILMLMRSFIYALIVAAIIVLVAQRMGYGWADQIITYVDQLARLGYKESLQLFLAADKPIIT